MKTFPLQITSLDGNLFAGDVVKLSLRGTEGEFAIMAGHIPFVTSVISAPIFIHLEDGEERHAHSEGGILTVGADKTILISGTFKFDE